MPAPRFVFPDWMRGIALSPRKNIVGVDGEKLLDRAGHPQAVRFESKQAVPDERQDIWVPDEKLERKLLAEYFRRNHDFRVGKANTAWRPSSIACGLPSGYGVMRKAALDWQPSDSRLCDIHGRPTLDDLIQWLEYPAVLRTIRAHSYAYGSQFRRTDPQRIAEQLSGPIWCWTSRGDRLEPSVAAACGKGMLNWYLLRSLWENGQIAPEPCFYCHTGCQAISPPNAKNLPFTDPRYDIRQGAESLLFFGNGLALVGRAKVYYDEPRSFVETLREGKTFGEAWARYFDAESKRARGGDIGRKKACFWSVLGDWTLRLAMADPQLVSGSK